ncbi:hypothetical protein [Peribacillus sp. SCS-37]|uniref:hypothetical protein n=1 Tax=Paraperibacillus esterisolvens TaxID=3115296 RepID=UPI003905DB33
MSKKKAIKLATATAIAASAFAAVAPVSQAATSVDAQIKKAIDASNKQQVKAFDTYYQAGLKGNTPPAAVVQKEIDAAKKLHADAYNLIKSKGGKNKTAYYTLLKKEDSKVVYAVSYVKAIYAASDIKKLSAAFDTNQNDTTVKALEDGIAKFKGIVAKIYGATERKLLVSKYADAHQKKADEYRATPKVVNVSAINATEVAVKFNKAVLESTVENAANFVFTTVAPAAPATLVADDIQLQADGKTVIVRFTAPLTEGVSYKAAVENILTAKYEKVTDFEGTYKFSDQVAPSVVGAALNGTDLELSFDEQVDFTNAIIRVDGYQVVGTPVLVGTSEAGKYLYNVSVTGTNAVTVGTHNITVVGLEDAVGNEAGTLTKSYVVSTDTTAPTVKSITAVDKDSFKVTFTESVAAAPSIKVMKGAVQYTATLASGSGAEYIYDLDLDTDSTTTGSTDGTGANPLYGTNDSSVTLSVEVSNYKDAVNLIGNTYNGSVTLSKDKTAPALLNSALNTIVASSGATVITVPFTETLTNDVDANVKVINPDGVELTPSSVTIVNGSKGANTALAVTVAGLPAVGTYQVVFSTGAVKDADLNSNAAFTTAVKYEAAQAYRSFVTGNAGVSVPSSNVVRVDFDTPVDSSALNVANYKLDNAALPAGTTAVYTSATKDVVELRLPSSFKVVADAAYKFQISQQVKTVAGEVIVANSSATTKADYVTSVTLLDNVAPELKSAKLLNSGATVSTTANEVELTFSEALPAIASGDATIDDDFIVKVNGVVTTATVKAQDAADNKVVLVFGSNINAAQTVSVQVAGTDLEIADANLNVIKAGTTVTATK